jgi:hypothetical protein
MGMGDMRKTFSVTLRCSAEGRATKGDGRHPSMLASLALQDDGERERV